MTSPQNGDWFGGFVDRALGMPDPNRGGGGTTNSTPLARRLSSTPPVRTGTSAAASLYDVLDGVPKEHAEDEFFMSYEKDPQASPDGRAIRYTVQAGLEWLRDQAVKNPEGYNSWVASLYQAGYLTENDVRFNTYTSKVGQAFVEAAIDVASTNASEGGGAVISLKDNLDALAEGNKVWDQLSGGGSGRQAPSRVDQKWDEQSLKSTLKSTSQGLLGRSLTDDEEKELVSRFRGIESQWNNQQWDAAQAEFNGQATTVPDRPDPDALADEFITNEHGTELGAQRLGSYMEVMRQMFSGGAL